MSELTDVTGVDFASELMLNKMMNGQVASSNGNTITAGLRAQASSLYRDSMEPSIASANVSAAIPGVTETQSAITEAKVYIENLYGNLNTDDYSTVSSTVEEGVAWLGEFLTQYGGSTTATEATATTVDIGLGSSYDVGGISLSSIAALYSALNALTTTTATDASETDAEAQTAALIELLDADTFDNAINEAIDGMTVTSMQINTLQNRSLMLEEVASTYSTAGDSQILTGAGSTSGLLSSILS